MSSINTAPRDQQDEQIRNALAQLKIVIDSGKLEGLSATEAAGLWDRSKNLLGDFDAYLETLKDIEGQDFFGTEPSFAARKAALDVASWRYSRNRSQ